MVVAVRCPNAKCKKYMLVEDADVGTVVPCLICKQGVKVPATGGPPPAPQPAPAPAPVPAPPPPPAPPMPAPTNDLTPIFDDEPDPGPQFKMD